jgi:cation transport ATPase
LNSFDSVVSAIRGVEYRRYGPRTLFFVALLGLAAGGWFWWRGDADRSHLAWALGTIPILLALFVQIIGSLRRSDVGLDVVAALSMSAALVFEETLAGNVVALMYSGGQLLESFAEGRARREMTALLGRVAFTAIRYRRQPPFTPILAEKAIVSGGREHAAERRL